MIQLHELRVGNKILEIIEDNKLPGFQTWLTVKEIKQSGIILSNGMVVNYHDKYRIEGILLTDDILQKIGFTVGIAAIKKSYLIEVKNSSKYFLLIPTVTTNYYSVMYDHKPGSIYIIYLHELQNEFFDLTGEELKVNLN